MPDEWDPDIAAMRLSDGEKEGVQLYRNYSRAFEKHAVLRFASEMDARTFDLSSLETILGHIRQEDVRILPVLVCAFADDELAEMFRREIPVNVPGGKSSMLGAVGPLSRFSQRIQIAYAFGWCNRDLLEELDKLRKLRNAFSHSWDLAKLEPKLTEFISAQMHKIEQHFAEGVRSPRDYAVILGPHGLFRLRLTWIAGRTFYESHLYVAAMNARIDPTAALYAQTPPKLLSEIAAKCLSTTSALA